ncbi:Protein of unknown function DUF247 [Theobroma cacao]|nr:Protein of unknown function DUF247 [Theobroma cacao]
MAEIMLCSVYFFLIVFKKVFTKIFGWTTWFYEFIFVDRNWAKDGSKLKVEFEKGVLQIPPIHVVHETEIIFRNFMAFEQCLSLEKAYFCNYIQLLNFLVDTDKDVDLLVKKGILFNGLGSSAAVTNMINNLMVGVTHLSSCYGKIGKDLKEH